MAAFVAERACDLGPIVLVGHSLGGAIALEVCHIAALRTQLVGLVLVATGARLRVSPSRLRAIDAAAVEGVPFVPGPAAWGAVAHPGSAEAIAAIEASTPPAVTRADWRAADAFDRIGRLEPLGAPARVFVGSADALTPPKYAEYLASTLACEAEIVPGAGHMLPFERPAWLAWRLRTLVLGGDAASGRQ